MQSIGCTTASPNIVAMAPATASFQICKSLEDEEVEDPDVFGFVVVLAMKHLVDLRSRNGRLGKMRAALLPVQASNAIEPKRVENFISVEVYGDGLSSIKQNLGKFCRLIP